MKRTLSLVAAGTLALGLLAVPASAQLVNFPVVANPAGLFGDGGTSVGIYGLFGRGLNDNSGKANAFGGGAVLGLGRVAVKAGAMSVSQGGNSEIGFGGQLEAGLFSPEGSPVAISAFGGFGTLNNAISMNVPFGVAIGIAPPMEGGTMISIWGAARGQLVKPDVTGASSELGFGGSGGVHVMLPMGILIGASADLLSIDFGGGSTSSLLFGVHAGYNFSVGGM